jgi:hypothetical protein
MLIVWRLPRLEKWRGLAAFGFGGMVDGRAWGIGLDGGLALFAFETIVLVAQPLVLLTQDAIGLRQVLHQIQEVLNDGAGRGVLNTGEIQIVEHGG